MRGPPLRRYFQVLFPVVIAAVLIVPRFVGSAPAGEPVTPIPSVVPASGALPALDGTLLSGGRSDAADLRGKVVVVNFWNYDCPPCRREQPALQAAWTALEGSGVRFVGVLYTEGGWPDDAAAARSYVTTFGVTYPTVVGLGAQALRAFAIPGIPVTVIADTSGEMRAKIVGPVGPGEIERVVAGFGA